MKQENLTLEDVQKNVWEFHGPIIAEIPWLAENDRVPSSTRDLMQQRINVLNSNDQKAIDYLWNNYFYTGDAVFGTPRFRKYPETDGRFKISLDSKIMRELNLDSTLYDGNGLLQLGNTPEESIAIYESIEGEEFTSEDRLKYCKEQSRKQAKSNPLWKAVTGNDQALTNEYIDAVFDRIQQEKGMDIDIITGLEGKFFYGTLLYLGSVFTDYGSGWYPPTHHTSTLSGRGRLNHKTGKDFLLTKQEPVSVNKNSKTNWKDAPRKESYRVINYSIDTRSRVDHWAMMHQSPQIEERTRVELVDGPFKEFYGSVMTEMSPLIESGRIPLSVRGFMKKRIESLQSSDEVRDYWWMNDFTTGDAIFYDPDKKVKIVLDAPVMRGLNNQNLIHGGSCVPRDIGGLIVGHTPYTKRCVTREENIAAYESLEGEEFGAGEIEELFWRRNMTPDQAKRNIVLKILSGHNQELLDSYIDASVEYYGTWENIQREISTGICGTTLAYCQREGLAVGYLWTIGNKYDWHPNEINGGEHLDSELGILIGATPKAIEQLGVTLENTV